MNKEVLKRMLRRSEKTQKQIAEEMEISQQALSARINGDMRLSSFEELVKAAGFRIVLLPDYIETPKEGIEV